MDSVSLLPVSRKIDRQLLCHSTFLFLSHRNKFMFPSLALLPASWLWLTVSAESFNSSRAHSGQMVRVLSRHEITITSRTLLFYVLMLCNRVLRNPKEKKHLLKVSQFQRGHKFRHTKYALCTKKPLAHSQNSSEVNGTLSSGFHTDCLRGPGSSPWYL